jgi:hypothetical protein
VQSLHAVETALQAVSGALLHSVALQQFGFRVSHSIFASYSASQSSLPQLKSKFDSQASSVTPG